MGGDRERQERGAILTVLMPFSPERARPPGAHSFARRARPALQPPPAAPAAAHGERSTAGAKRRGSASQTPAVEWRRARASLCSHRSATERPAAAPARPWSVPPTSTHPRPEQP